MALYMLIVDGALLDVTDTVKPLIKQLDTYARADPFRVALIVSTALDEGAGA